MRKETCNYWLSAFGFCNFNECDLSSVPLSRKWSKSQTLSTCQNINNIKMPKSTIFSGISNSLPKRLVFNAR